MKKTPSPNWQKNQQAIHEVNTSRRYAIKLNRLCNIITDTKNTKDNISRNAK